MANVVAGLAIVSGLLAGMVSAVAQEADSESLFQWESSKPLLMARDVDGWPWHSVKDPTIVRHDRLWHLFTTVRGSDRSHAIMYTAFADWDQANKAPRRILPMHSGYFCAPQVFWFEPHQCWYLICQASDESWGEKPFRPAFATTTELSNPDSWSKLTPMFRERPANIPGWIDFWVICDDQSAWLFFTANNGQMWRCQTSLQDFPLGWSTPVLALQDRLFEASHTYRIRGRDQYLTVVEEQNGYGFRYYKAWLADRLDGEWRPLAATKDQSFASLKNVVLPAGAHWTDSISHGELLRAGTDQRMEIDPDHLQFLYQGATNAEKAGRSYGEIPWQLGLLKLQGKSPL
ncbi:MAG: hypothetical protein KDA85_07965 [Planctomycetaceae bacterium]|nr:hypothetical protein [Planctomycetaceae bacterium]